MTSDDFTLPDPPWGDEIDLGVFQRIEMDVRLFSSPVFTGLDPEAALALIKLIVEAWRWRPAMSVPAHQATLAEAAGFGRDVATWARLEPVVLAHWTLCTDDRFYFLPMQDAVLDAHRRLNVRRGGDSRRKARQRLRAELAKVGVVNVSHIGDGVIDTISSTVVEAGLRGQARRDLMIRLASDHNLLPDGPVAELRPADGNFRQLGAVQPRPG